MEVSQLILLFRTACNGSPILLIRKHVYQDLHPYVCLEKYCTKASQDFQSREQWAFHMLKEHWRTWNCPFGCSLSFRNSDDARRHVLEVHPTEVSAGRVKDLVDLSSNADLRYAEGKCPLCLTFDIKGSRVYESHVGRHLEQLALLFLPHTFDDENDQDKDTEYNQFGDWEINSGEEQASDVVSDAGSEALPGPELQTENDFGSDELHAEYEQTSDSAPEELRPKALVSSSNLAFVDEVRYERMRKEDDPLPLYDHDYRAHRNTDGHEGKTPGGKYDGLATISGAPRTSRPCGVSGCKREIIFDLIKGKKEAFCQEHTCQAPGNYGFCINPRDPASQYCVLHGKCIGDRGCVAQAGRSETKLFPYICPQHCCTISHYYLPRLKSNFCERHACRTSSCRKAKIGISNDEAGYCQSHECMAPGCHNETYLDEGGVCYILTYDEVDCKEPALEFGLCSRHQTGRPQADDLHVTDYGRGAERERLESEDQDSEAQESERRDTKQRHRSNPRETWSAPGQDKRYRETMASAASYTQKIRNKASNISPRHTAVVPTYSAAYPDPNERWTPRWRSLGDGKHHYWAYTNTRNSSLVGAAL